MGAIWLTDLAAVLRVDNPGFPISTVAGWETRSNSHGGYDAVNGICIHHDVSSKSDLDGSASANYQCFGDPERPNAALHVGRDGTIWVMAAGACNTQGQGGPLIGVPNTSSPYAGNMRIIGIEQGNNGTGEPYPTRQQDATLWLVRRLVAVYGPRFGFGPDHVIAHFEWAPSRKNDPAGPSRWAPQGGRWNMPAFRADVLQPTMEDLTIMEPTTQKYLDLQFAKVAELMASLAKQVSALDAKIDAMWTSRNTFLIKMLRGDGPGTDSHDNESIEGAAAAAVSAREAVIAAQQEILDAIAGIPGGTGGTVDVDAHRGLLDKTYVASVPGYLKVDEL